MLLMPCNAVLHFDDEFVKQGQQVVENKLPWILRAPPSLLELFNNDCVQFPCIRLTAHIE